MANNQIPMTRPTRKSAAVLLLTLMLSVGALNAHAASHVPSDSIDCAMCAAFFGTACCASADTAAIAVERGGCSQSLEAISCLAFSKTDTAFPRGPPRL